MSRPETGLRVVCIAPAWNEENRIGPVVEAAPRSVVDEMVVVDDGSTDQTRERARAAGATVLEGAHRGVGAAIRLGIDYAIRGGYDVAVVVSGAGKTPPAQIPQLLGPILAGHADLAQGSRYAEGGRFLRMTLSRKIGTRAYTFLFSLLVGRRVTDASSGFRAIRLSLFADKRINLWQPWLDGYELEPYLLFQALRLRHRVVEVPVTIEYPDVIRGQAYTKMRAWSDWYRIFRPVLFLALGLKR
jgi:dolichol-phosphate mannosyltransferase